MRGLKQQNGYTLKKIDSVAPLVGAWIETICGFTCCIKMDVAPLVGAWIETNMQRNAFLNLNVAPLVGAWIETNFGADLMQQAYSRTSCRCVD